MKCFTLKADKDVIVLPSFHHPLTYVAPELYPKPRTGLRVRRGQAELEISPELKVALSPELLATCKAAQDDPEMLLIESASLERQASGALLLVPEKDCDKDRALVLLDLGRGSYNSVRYEVGNRVFLRARRNSDALFGSEELALVELPVNRPFYAYRSSRRWYCFGTEVVGERLQVRFDGRELSCDEAR
jgi:hypothetical protein